MKYLLSIVVFCFFINISLKAQQLPEHVIEPIEAQLETMLDGQFELMFAIPVDTTTIGRDKGTQSFTLRDPYQTLEHNVIFTARRSEEDQHGSWGDWVWGIYSDRDRQVRWVSRESFFCFSLDLYNTIDLTLDGRVEILMQCLTGSMQYMSGQLYIYSWDGEQGELISDLVREDSQRISDMMNDGESVLYSTAPLSFGYVDITGDGIMEIRALMETGDIMSDDYKTETIIWSWNGQLYGRWPDTPEDRPYYPRNLAEADVEVITGKQGNQFSYDYIVVNRPESKRSIQEIEVHMDGWYIEHTSPSGWHFYDRASGKIVNWSVRFRSSDSRPLIEPGQTTSEFQIVSSSPPSPGTIYILSENSRGGNRHPDFRLNEYREYRKTNSYSTSALVPGPDPDSIGLEAYTDSLHSWIEVAYENSWITNQGVSQSLKASLQNTKRQLEGGNTHAAANSVQAFLNEVEAIREQQLSSEAYALLRFNGEYLHDRLVEEIER